MKDQFNKLMKKAFWLLIIIFCSRCIFSWDALINNGSIYDAFSYAGESIGISALIITIYERWIWKYLKLESVPILHKKYSGVIISSYNHSHTEREADLYIKQTLLSVKITLNTEQSTSISVSSSIDKSLGENLLIYTYLNIPKALYRKKSCIHYGTAMLHLDDPKFLVGTYFTDRGTIGDMRFRIRKSNK